jgi:hypothetical protein
VTFIKGQSGNPAGRPRKGDSLAEAVRARLNPAKRREVIDRIIQILRDDGTNPDTRIRAFEALAKRGWPDEAKGELTLNAGEGFALPVRVVHEYRSS